MIPIDGFSSSHSCARRLSARTVTRLTLFVLRHEMRFAYRVLILKKGGVDMWKSLKVGVALSGVLFLGLTACNQSPPASRAPKGPSPASQAWNKLTAGFIQSYLNARPAFAAQTGRHEFDGQLPDFSSHGIR